MREEKRKTVFVGISGGVDSSVAAYLLQQAGYTVVGAFIKTWQPDFIRCTWREERRDAMRVCAHLGIPFVTVDLEAQYREAVAMEMIASYRRGETPNPDVLCNQEIKFGAFWEYARRHGADAIATGHYVQNKVSTTGTHALYRGADPKKDQSYFLWTLTQDDLAHALFPVGEYMKDEVRDIAATHALPTAEKKDSQGVCFLGEIDMKDFLAHYIPSADGEVRATDGSVIGHHAGAHFFTLGERHGFTITKKSTHDRPYYVVAKDITQNTITVSHDPHNEKKFHTHQLHLADTNWISETPKPGKRYVAQIRYHGKELSCQYHVETDGTEVVAFDEPVIHAAAGQSVVLYSKKRCLGGGVIVY